MGGNALKNTTTRRYAADEYFTVVEEVQQKLHAGIRVVERSNVIEAYRTKESFGDADILYSTYPGQGIHVADIQQVFNPNEIVKNGDVISFDYKELQIDLIYSPADCYDYALSYFAFNDLGNLVGKLTKRFNLSHGHKGLYLPLRDGTNMFDSILITHDHDATLKFVGLNPNTFVAGFDTLDEIFNFVATSPQYNPEIYALENISSIGRIRDKKRDTYRKFLEFGANYTGYVTPYVKGSDKSIFLERIFAAFPDALPRFQDAVNRLTVSRAVKAKFNGTLVAEMTKLSGQDLGHFMKLLKEDFNFTPAVLLYLSPEQIETKVLAKYYDVFK